MHPQILMRNAARRELYKEAVERWYRMDPGQAREAIRYIRDITAQDVRNGKWEDEDVMVSVRFPSDLFFLIRGLIDGWGDNSDDMRDFLREFPDIIPVAMQRRIGLHRRGQSKRTARSAKTVGEYLAGRSASS